MHMTYTVKEFTQMFHVTEHTVCYYTDIGLLPCNRDGGNHRVFDDSAANWMRGITCLKSCGMPIKDIKRYIDLCQMEESEENLLARYRIIAKQREAAHKKVAEAKATADYMDFKLKHYEEILAGHIPDDTNPANWSD